MSAQLAVVASMSVVPLACPSSVAVTVLAPPLLVNNIDSTLKASAHAEAAPSLARRGRTRPAPRPSARLAPALLADSTAGSASVAAGFASVVADLASFVGFTSGGAGSTDAGLLSTGASGFDSTGVGVGTADGGSCVGVAATPTAGG